MHSDFPYLHKSGDKKIRKTFPKTELDEEVIANDSDKFYESSIEEVDASFEPVKVSTKKNNDK